MARGNKKSETAGALPAGGTASPASAGGYGAGSVIPPSTPSQAPPPATPAPPPEGGAQDPKKHSFWTAPRGGFYEPKFQYRFIVEIPGMGLEDHRNADGSSAADADEYADIMKDGLGNGYVWYAKSIDKPGYSVQDLVEDHYYSANNKASPIVTVHSVKYKPVSMTLIDPGYPDATRKFARFLRRTGFHDDAATNATVDPTKSYLDSVAGGKWGDREIGVHIHQINEKGKIIETCKLVNAYPADVDFGKLDYSSNDPVEITVKWLYKSFIIDYPVAIGAEKPFAYFKDHKGTAAAKGINKCRDLAKAEWGLYDDAERADLPSENVDEYMTGKCGPAAD